MSDAPQRDDARLWETIQQTLDEGRDPWAEPDLADALADRPDLADALLRLTERLELLATLDGPAVDPAPAGAPSARPAAAVGEPSPSLALLPTLAVAAVVLLALRLVLVGDGADVPPTSRPGALGADAVARAGPPGTAPAVPAQPVASRPRPAVRVLGWSLRVAEHRPDLELRRERRPGRQTLVARDLRGAVAMTTLRSLR